MDEGNIKILVDLYNSIYSTGITPKDWLISMFITSSKKPKTRLCTDYRRISLITDTLKAFLKTIHNRTHKYVEVVEELERRYSQYRNNVQI